MNIDNRVVIPLKIFLAGLFVVLLIFQTLSIPGGAAYRAEQSPDLAYLRWPETAVGVSLILCVQVIVVSTWRLLGLVHERRIFSDAAFVWVDAIVWAIAAAWVVLVSVLVLITLNADDPGGPFVLFLVVLVVAAVGLLMVVMRALLRQATTLRADMEAVI